jgi:hypothetical protein
MVGAKPKPFKTMGSKRKYILQKLKVLQISKAMSIVCIFLNPLYEKIPDQK